MPETQIMTRRSFIKSASATGVAMLSMNSNTTTASETKEPRFLFGGFTKTLQHLGLDYEETAEAVAEIGWDGIECPVRPKGHVLPERVEDDLPAMEETLRKRDMKILVMATAIHNADEPHTEKVLRTAAGLGIKYYRMGWWQYESGKSIQDRLKEIKPQLRDLADLNRELGICGVYQNHSGNNYVGAAVWDIYELIKDIDSRYIASHFDIGHATVEGGYSWPIQYRLMKPLIGAFIVKDFNWKRTPGKGGTAQWCPLGEGLVSDAFFEMVKKSDYCGPVTQHFEYPVGGESTQQQLRNRIQAMKKDGRTLRKLLTM